MNTYLPDFIPVPGIILKDKDTQPLDGLVYGIIYWYTKLKLERCTATNAMIGKLLDSHPRSISRSISRLEKKKYITSIYDEFNHRVEIIPNLSFSPGKVALDDSTPTGEPPYTNR